MRFLNGRQIADFVQVRQTKAVARLKQTSGQTPGLAIIVTTDNQSINTYVNLKQAYAEAIGVNFVQHRVSQAELPSLMSKLKTDKTIHGVVLQLPLADPTETDKLCKLIPAVKDIDGLNPASSYDGATAQAVNWLLTGYNIELKDKRIVVIGQGKLVGAPLLKIWQAGQLAVKAMDKDNLSRSSIKQAQVIVTATGQPNLLQADDIGPRAVVVDAGSACVDGQIAGDLDPQIYQNRDDLTITPKIGGLGPVTIAVLFENLLAAAEQAT